MRRKATAERSHRDRQAGSQPISWRVLRPASQSAENEKDQLISVINYF